MTDGACKIIKAMDGTQVAPFSKAFEKMTSRDPAKFWTRYVFSVLYDFRTRFASVSPCLLVANG